MGSVGADGVAVRWRGAGMPPSAPAVDGAGRLVADSVAVIGIQGQSGRESARRAIREAIVDELALLTGLPHRRIALHTPEGRVPYALLDTPEGQGRAALAISHDGALSLAAISLRGQVGIDVTLLVDVPDWQAVARDYLGPAVAARLAALPAAARPDAFSRAWSEREARLKYLGRELVEWSDGDDRALAACRCLPLILPQGYAGVLALPPGPAGRDDAG